MVSVIFKIWQNIDFQGKIVIAIDRAVVMAKGIIDDTHVLFFLEMPPFILSKKDGCAGFLLQDRDGENDEQTHFVMKLHRITETTEMELEFPIVSTSSDVGGKIADNRKWILQVTRKIPNSPDVIEKIPLQVRL